MANELTITGVLQFQKGVIAAESLSLSSAQFNVTGSKFVKDEQSVPTTAGGTAINIGPLASLGWFMIKNTDTVNYVQLLNAVSGTVLLKIEPGEIAMGRFDPTVTAPALLANTAPVVVEFMIVEN
jgi:hypothetical protein